MVAGAFLPMTAVVKPVQSNLLAYLRVSEDMGKRLQKIGVKTTSICSRWGTLTMIRCLMLGGEVNSSLL